MSDELGWAFTRDEGTEWIPFTIHDIHFEKKLMEQLTDKSRWVDKTKTRTVRTALSCVPGYVVLFVHSVRFPDGRVWDSHFRDFDVTTIR